MADKLKMALVGCGAICKVHVPAIREGAPQIEITAVVDRDIGRARALAAETGAASFGSLDEALAHGDFAAVDLMLPHDSHETAAIAAFAAGKHVLLEKPMAPTVEACDRILAAWKRSDRVFLVAENAQYWPDVLVAKEAIDGGAIGELVTGRASIFFPPLEDYYGDDSGWRFDREATGGGVTIDTGSHWIRPMRMLMGELDEVVAAIDRPVERMEGESLARALLRFESGKIGVFDALLSYGPLAPELFFRVTGRDGEVTIDGAGKVVLYDSRSPGGRTIGQSTGYFESYPAQFADFAAAVLRGAPLAAGPEYALGELRAALAMYRSAESRGWEKVWG